MPHCTYQHHGRGGKEENTRHLTVSGEVEGWGNRGGGYPHQAYYERPHKKLIAGLRATDKLRYEVLVHSTTHVCNIMGGNDDRKCNAINRTPKTRGTSTTPITRAVVCSYQPICRDKELIYKGYRPNMRVMRIMLQECVKTRQLCWECCRNVRKHARYAENAAGMYENTPAMLRMLQECTKTRQICGECCRNVRKHASYAENAAGMYENTPAVLRMHENTPAMRRMLQECTKTRQLC